MAQILGIALSLGVLGLISTPDHARIARRFRTAYRFVLPNRGKRRAQGNYERAA